MNASTAVTANSAAAQDQRSHRPSASTRQQSNALSREISVYAWLALLTLAAWLISKTGLYTNFLILQSNPFYRLYTLPLLFQIALL